MERNRKIWMQILALAAVLRFFPVDFQMAVPVDAGQITVKTEEQQTEKPKLALTFDDGPSREHTSKLLDGLKERGVKATFF